MFPIIPLLAGLVIVGGVSTLVWYSSQSRERQREADRLALEWFGRRFRDLAKAQQDNIRDRMS